MNKMVVSWRDLPVSDRRSHVELSELQLDDLADLGNDAVQHAADSGRVEARIVG